MRAGGRIQEPLSAQPAVWVLSQWCGFESQLGTPSSSVATANLSSMHLSVLSAMGDSRTFPTGSP